MWAARSQNGRCSRRDKAALSHPRFDWRPDPELQLGLIFQCVIRLEGCGNI
jgi:hypothetical protein